MALPFFLATGFGQQQQFINLPEEASRHIVQVLRMKKGGRLQVTDGQGTIGLAELATENKKAAEVRILSTSFYPASAPRVSVAISLVKNTSRFEWFLEKATEIGVNEIIPLICERTEKQHFRLDRMKNILVSAMLQSQQAWLPVLSEPVSFASCVSHFGGKQGFIAHCVENEKRSITQAYTPGSGGLILIGPEGDFTTTEIQLALGSGCIPVSLGETRLRTETAGIVAATILKMLS